MADISAIKLPSGTTYNIKDSISGYTTNTGTITQVKTTAGAHTTIDVSSGAATFNVPTKTSHLTNDSGFLTSHLAGRGAIDVSNNQISLKIDAKPVASIFKHTIDNISGLVLVLDDGSTDGESLFIPDGVGFNTGSQAIINQIPTKTSDLTNDSNFITTEVFYGTCTTAASTAAKVVTCANFTSSDLKAGTIIVVNFSVTNSAAVADLTLNINGTGAKKIQYINNGTRGNLSGANYIKASTSYPFIYDGTYWLAQLNYNSNTTYSVMTQAEMQTGTATTARTITAARLKEAILYHTENNKDIFEFEIVSDALGQPEALAEGVTVADIQAAIEAGKEVILVDPNNNIKATYTPYAGSISTLNGECEYIWFEYFYDIFYRSEESSEFNYDSPQVLIYGVNTNTEDTYNQIYFETIDLVTYSQFNTNATYGTSGLVKPAYSTTGTASFSTTPQAYANNPSIAARTTTSNRYYGIEVDSNGRLFVNVPWAADTNTTYALSSTLSSHKFTSTLTAGGSGSGTSTSDFTLAAGTGITITDDTSARKMTIACSVTNTDEKVKAAALTSGTLYYPILATGTGTATRQIDSTLKGLTYKSTAGTSSIVGTAQLTIGNSTASGRPDNEQGQIILYGSTAYAHTIVGEPTINTTITLPNATGTLALDTVVTAGSSVSSGGLMSQADKTRLDGLPDVVELTQAEYNALSTSEKNNGTIYYVTDRPVNGLNNLRDGTAAGSLEMTTTSALKSYQVALGTYNLEDTGNDKDLSDFAFIIGNGISDNARSNLFTVNKSGLVTTHITPTEDYDWDTSIAPAEDQYFTGFEIRDSVGIRTTHMDTHSDSNGTVLAAFGAERLINGETIRNQLFLQIEADGTKSYWLDNPTEFAKAIGLGYSVADCTRASGWTDYTSGYGPVVYRRGGVCTFHWEAKPTASSVTINGTPVTICTVPSGYRPIRTTYTICQGSATSIYVLQINSNGAVTIQRLRENANANGVYTNGGSGSYSWFPMYMTYVCAP